MGESTEDLDFEPSSGVVKAGSDLVINLLRGLRKDQAADGLERALEVIGKMPSTAGYKLGDKIHRIRNTPTSGGSSEMLDDKVINELIDALPKDEDSIVALVGALQIQKENDFISVDQQQITILDIYARYLNEVFEKIRLYGGPIATKDFFGSTDILFWKAGFQNKDAVTRKNIPFEARKGLDFAPGYRIFKVPIEEPSNSNIASGNAEDDAHLAVACDDVPDARRIESVNIELREQALFASIEEDYKSGLGVRCWNIFEDEVLFVNHDRSEVRVRIDPEKLDLNRILPSVETAIDIQSRRYHSVVRKLPPGST